MFPIIFIVGPTAVGKTELAYRLAKRISGQIISCDSMLVYKEPCIITSKPSDAMLKDIPHHFINIISVKEEYNVYMYFTSAKAKIEQLFRENVPIIVCGGSGLYMKALLDGIFGGISADKGLRRDLYCKAAKCGGMYLYEELKKVDEETALRLSPNDLKRIIRALEVYYKGGQRLSEKKSESYGIWRHLPIKIFGLTLERKLLYQKINERTEQMFEEGAVEEAKNLLKMDLSITAEKIIGVKEIKGYLEGKYSLVEAKFLMAKNTRNFAKRQFTWFKREKRIEWVGIKGKSITSLVEFIIDRSNVE